MKKLLLLLFISFFTKNLSAQECCPYINNVELSPTMPTTVDSIYLITHVATPNQGTFLGYTITETDTLTTVEACYYNGLATVITDFQDTLNLGVRPAGTFNVKFIGWTSGSMDTCTFTQSQSMNTAINVETSNATFTPNLSSISIFPNPSTDIFHLKMEGYPENINIELFSPLGQLLQTFNLGSTLRIVFQTPIKILY